MAAKLAGVGETRSCQENLEGATRISCSNLELVQRTTALGVGAAGQALEIEAGSGLAEVGVRPLSEEGAAGRWVRQGGQPAEDHLTAAKGEGGAEAAARMA